MNVRSIKEATNLIKNGQLKKLDVLQKSLKQIANTKEFNAFVATKENFDNASPIKKKLDVLQKSLKQIANTKEFNAFVATKENFDNASIPNCEGKLNGITFAVKDNFSTKDLPTTCASKILENYNPPYNATVVQKLLDEGATLVGKTNLDEFAMGSGCVDSIFGPTKNPWTLNTDLRSNDDWFITGGSSGGSAVAVATGACTFALGSDTGGSVRNPAAYCGVVGLKPTYGLVSRHGLISLVNSMDVPGIMAKKVEDVEIVFEILAGHDPMDSTTYHSNVKLRQKHLDGCIKGLKVGVPKECEVPEISDEMGSVWRWLADTLQTNGAQVEKVSLPHSPYAVRCYHVLCAAEVMSNMARYDGLKFGHRSDVYESTNAMFAVTRREGFCDTVRSRILLGSYFLLRENTKKYYEKALKVRRLIYEDYNKVFGLSPKPNEDNFIADVILSPVVLSDAPLHSEFIKEDNRTRCTEQDIFTQPANLAGVPAISVPIGLSKRGLPLGIQITGPQMSDYVIMQVAKFLEEKVQFPHNHLNGLIKSTDVFKRKQKI